MAGITNDNRLLLTDAQGVRKTWRLGFLPKRDAERLRDKVTDLETALKLGTPLSTEVATWASKLPEASYGKLAGYGLLPRKETKCEVIDLTLGSFLTAYLTRRTDAKASSVTVWKHTVRNLLGYFGSDKPLRQINEGDAKDFERHLKSGARLKRYNEADESDGLKPNTIRKRLGIAKMFFNDALERELIARNPFAKFQCSVRSNRDRDYFLTTSDALEIVKSCPDAQWRLLFALCRWGGLRCPSEVLLLKWSDIDWERGRMTVTSPKTAHHENKGERVIPIFPRVKPYLDAVWEQAEAGTEFVITRYRRGNQNLRTTFAKIIRRAGLTPWPKLFANLRANCSTEVDREFGHHLESVWIGHSARIAKEHYLQVTEDDFNRATRACAQNCAQNGPETGGNDPQASTSANTETPVFPGFAVCCKSLQHKGMDVTGLEPVTPTMSTWYSNQLSYTSGRK